jgi:hypothetical protein
MKMFPLSSDRVSLAVTETGGHLSDVAFDIGSGERVKPMHTAPWTPDEPGPGTDPILRVLRGDFFCAPFAANDVDPTETRIHGATANGIWRLAASGDGFVDVVLDTDVMGARVTKRVEVRPGEAMVYQRHTLDGGKGRLPLGQHAMLHADPPLRLAFSPFVWAGTPPVPVETPPGGRSALATGQTIADLTRTALADGGTADVTRFPFDTGHDDILSLASDPGLSFAWTAATCAERGWTWFGLKDPRILPETLVWMSHGGRRYAPWSSRHTHCIGLEEICSYFHLGHAASIADNPLSLRGIPTATTLRPNGSVVIPYMFGLVATPPGFSAVARIEEEDGGVILSDAEGREAFAACDVSFVTCPA